MDGERQGLVERLIAVTDRMAAHSRKAAMEGWSDIELTMPQLRALGFLAHAPRRMGDLAAEALAEMEGTPVDEASAAGGLAPGKVLGNYRLVRVLGAGGMATVYEAVHRRIGRRAAIKVLHARVARDPQLAQRFVNEARAVNLIRHPGLVKIDEFGLLDDGTYFLVMEHLDGEALDRRLDRVGRCAVAEAISIARQVALALAAAHAQGVVHRDLKPGNVILTRDPDEPGRERAKVLDFGIARLTVAFDEEGGEAQAIAPIERTRSNVIMGTPAYMSPEQCRDTAHVTEKTDVYALGVMLFELLAGRRPFVAELASEVMTMHVKAEPPSLEALAPEVPQEVVRLVERMLTKDPAARPSMTEVAEALRDVTVIAPGRLRRFLRRRGRMGIGLAAAAIVGAVVTFRFVLPARAGMVRVPGGAFEMGSTPEEIDAAYHYCLKSELQAGEQCILGIFEREQPRRTVRLSPFDLDVTEVTNADFAAWLNAQRGLRNVFDDAKKERWVYSGDDPLVNLYPTYPVHGLSQSDNRFQPVAGAEQLPVTQVTWIGASRYCAARGARLPTEAEWEYAARPHPGDRFPWGVDPPRCDGVAFGRMQGQMCAGFRLGPAKVGTMPMDCSPLGIRDLAGNVAEWVQDRFEERYADCQDNCADPVAAEPKEIGKDPIKRVFRGGDWGQVAPICRSAGRGRKPQTMAFQNIGFRCARSVRPGG